MEPSWQMVVVLAKDLGAYCIVFTGRLIEQPGAPAGAKQKSKGK